MRTMEISGTVLETDRRGFRLWLEDNHDSADFCWVVCPRKKPENGEFCYLDAVEEAICFGWIDSTLKRTGGKTYNRFSPRKKGSHRTELNKERARRLERLGLMRESGREALPDMDAAPRMDPNIRRWFRKNPEMEARFMSYPGLYRRIQLSNLEFYRDRGGSEYRRRLKSFRKHVEDDRMIPGWDDYGRLTGNYSRDRSVSHRIHRSELCFLYLSS